MNLGSKIYFKEFISSIDYIDTSRHGSSDLKPYQGRNPEDKKVQESLVKKFSSSGNIFNIKREEFKGFDGIFQYDFSFREENLNDSDKEEHQYNSLVIIRRMGLEKNISQKSDIEKELMILGFKSK